MTDLVVRPQGSALEVSPRDLKQKADLLTNVVTGAYGKKLQPVQAMQLAFIAETTGLNPLVGELYMTDTGPQIGVLAYERKAQEYLDATLPGVTFRIQYRPAVAGVDASFDPDRGDVAYVAMLYRDDWDARWQKSFAEMLKLMKDAGLSGAEAVKEAKGLVGEKPCAEYVGVVDGRESFSGSYKQDDKRSGAKAGDDRPEMMDRHERAKKRARKGVIKHEFPRLDIPDPLDAIRDGQALMQAAMQVRDVTPDHVKGKTQAELLTEITGEEPEDAQVVIERPYDPDTLKRGILSKSKTSAKLSDGARKALPGNMNQLFAGYDDPDAARHTVTKYLFGQDSTSKLTDGQAYALSMWIGMYKTDEGEWLPNIDAVTEARAAHTAALKASGQQELF